MVRHVLVPVDLSDRNINAVKAAAKFADGDQGQITLLHVIETIQHLEFDESREFYDAIEKKATDKVGQLMTSISDLGVAVQPQIRYGKPVREIIMFAAENACDLIVLSSHKIEQADFARGLGTVSHQVAFLSQTSV